MTHAYSRTLQWMGIILVAALLGVGYWYFSVRAGVRPNTSLSQPAGVGRLESALTAYFALDENTGTAAADSSTNAITSLTLTNGPTWTAGQINTGIDFDGTNQYATTADTAILDFGDSEDFTLTGWFNRDTFTTDDTVIAKRNGIANTDDGYIVYIDDSTDKLTFEVSEASGTDEYQLESSSAFTATGWHHFVIVWDQDSASASEIYIDGASDNATDTGTIGNLGDLSNSDAFRIAAESDAGNPFDGKLDEIRVYNRPLFPEEVPQLYRLTSPTGVDTGLKGYWSFDGGAMATSTTVRDLSGARNVGTLNGTPSRLAGRVSQALNFDGTDDYVNLGSATNIDNLTNLSACAWIYPEAIGGTNYGAIISQMDNGGAEGTLQLTNVTSTSVRLQWYRDFSTTDGIWETVDETGFSSIPLNNWHYVCVTYNNSSIANDPIIYINGTAAKLNEAQTPAGSASTTAGGDYYIGATDNGGAGTDFFDGRIDEVRLYNRILTAVEIQSMYQMSERDEVSTSSSQAQGGGRLDSGVIAYWALDETTGATATDSSNSANNVSLTNMENADWITGQIGNGLDFDGAGEYGTSNRSIPQRGTIAMWLKTGASINTSAEYYAVSAAVSGNFFRVYANTFTTFNSFCFAMRGAFGTSITDFCGPAYDNSTTFQEWHHVAATFDATKGATVYIDGAIATAVSTGTGAFDPMGLNLSINDTTTDWLGRLDEVRMYNRILSPDEIGQLYRTSMVTPLETNLKGYWAFSGQDVSSTTVFDMSGTGNDGVLTNTPTRSSGIVGSGYDFDGTDDYLSVTDAATLDFTTSADFTLSGWFRRDTFTTDDTVVAKRNGIANTDDGYICYIDDTTDKLTCEMSEAGGTDEFQLETPQTFTSTEWNHFALVWDDDSASATDIYINGVATSATETGTIANIGDLSNAVTLRLGAESDAGNPFDGKLDEYRVYNRILTAAEIKAQYETAQRDLRNSSASQPQGSGRLDSGLALYYALDETTGSSAPETSTNANTGTLTNMENGDWVAAQVNNGLDFDGVDEYVTVADTSTLDFGDTESFTITGWFNRDTATTDDTIVAKRNGIANTDDGYICYLDDATDQLICEVSESGGTDEYSVTSVATFTGTGWNQFAFVWDQASATPTELYINGVANNATDSGTIGNLGDLSNSDAFRVGAESDAGNPFDGKLDEIRLHSRALSPDEIGQLYRLSTSTGADTGLKGYWSFNGQDMATSTVARDLSGAGNSGTLTNTPTKAIGKLGQALNFVSASSQYVNAGSASNIDDFVTISTCGWVKPNASLTASGTVIGKFNNTPTGWSMFITNASSVLYLGWVHYFNGANGTWLSLDSIPFDEWTHVCVTYDDSSTANDPVLYVNGTPTTVVETVAPTGTADTDATGNAMIGAIDAGTIQDLFNGAIDEVRLYNRILTAAEVKMLYDASR